MLIKVNYTCYMNSGLAERPAFWYVSNFDAELIVFQHQRIDHKGEVARGQLIAENCSPVFKWLTLVLKFLLSFWKNMKNAGITLPVYGGLLRNELFAEVVMALKDQRCPSGSICFWWNWHQEPEQQTCRETEKHPAKKKKINIPDSRALNLVKYFLTCGT